MNERREQHKRPVAVVVNDDITQLNVLAGLLSKEDLEVRVFESAEAAMDAMKQGKPPDLIVTDLSMSGIDGWRFCSLLRSPEFAAFNLVPILVVSATFSGDDASRITRELDANAFLSMPAEAPRLIRTVRALIRGEEPRRPSRALIVEDSGTLSGILSKTFTVHGYKTDTALSGAEATEKFTANTPDVVLLSYPLPDVASDALLEDFRRTNPDVVCIMMTLDPRPELALEWIKKGAAAYVRMPFQPEYLIELCARFRRERSLLYVENFLKQRTQQLYEAEKRYRSIFENAVEGIFQSTPDGRYITVNPAFAKMYGYESPEKMMADVADIEKQLYVYPEDRQKIKRLLEKDGRVRELETAFRRKDGSRLWASVNATAVRDEKGNPLCYEGTVVDITERKRLEARIIQSQKMEAVGTLAGGIAHDFNNVLASIVGYTELAMLKGISENSQAGDCLDQVLKASQRARDLVKQIMMFSRQSDVEKKPVQLTPIIKETVKFLRATLPTNIEIKRRISATSDVVLADPIQIHQVLMNLCTNAAHAMRQEGGVLKIMLTDMDAEEPSESLPAPHNNGCFFNLSVSDTGHGIDPENLDKIFDPFFTTKSSGEGTGMGLSVVYGIVKDLNGNITVQSEQNKGSTFSISLPRGEEQFVPSPLPLSSLPTGSECVLLVDDEESLVNMGKDMLHYLGYKVIAARGSMEALDDFRALPEQFDLVITDLNMPIMSGYKLADELLQIRPDIPIILCTGLGQSIIEEEAISRGIRQVLVKPFNMDNYAKIVRKVLDEGKNG